MGEKLKNKLANLLRRWADKLSPAIPIDFPDYVLERKTFDVQRVAVQLRYPVRYEEFYDRVISKEIASKLADSLAENNAISIKKDKEGGFCIYTGELNVVFPSQFMPWAAL